MVTINIAELQEDADTSLYEFLRSQTTQAFRIIIPFNENIGEWDDLFAWYQHYYYGFYLAEAFHEISYKASYSFPLTYGKKPFRFNVYGAPPALLATTILEAASIFHSECLSEDLYDRFHEKASDFWQKVGDHELVPCCRASLRFFNILCAELP